MPTLQEIIQLEQAKADAEVLLFREGLFLKAYEGSAQQLAARYGFKVTVRYVKTAGCRVASVGFPFASLGAYAPQAVERGGRWVVVQAPAAVQPLEEWKQSLDAAAQHHRAEAEVAAAVRQFPLESSTPLDCMQFLARLKRMLLLLSTVFFIIGPARGCPAFVVVDSYVSTPRLSNISPPHSPLRTPNSELLTPHSALLTPHSALLTPHS